MVAVFASIALAQGQGRWTDRWGRPVGTRAKPTNYAWNPPEPGARWDLDHPDEGGMPDSPSFAARLEWVRSTFGTGIGATGLHVVDLDADGTNEIVSAASTSGFFSNVFWTVIARDGASYDHIWVGPVMSPGIACLRVFQCDQDPALEVVVASAGRISIYDGKGRFIQQTIQTSAPTIQGLNYADVDSDGTSEFVFTDGSTLWIYNASTGAEEFRGPSLGGRDVAVGNVDADPDLEIVVGNDTANGYVLNGRTRAVEWTNSTGFGRFVRLGNLDADPYLEIVSGNAWYLITSFDADTRTPKYTISASLDIAAVEIVDVDGDGLVEVVYGDGQWGSINVCNGQDGGFKWSFANPEHGVTDVAFADLDGDPIKELVFGAGYTSTGPDHLFVVDGATRALAWQNVDFSGPFYALDYGDVDRDGRSEILFGAFESDSGYADGLYFVHDSKSKRLEYTSPEATGVSWNGLWRVRNTNVDSDPQPEIFITASNAYDGFVICYDSLLHTEQFRTTPLEGQSIRALAVVDSDLDGRKEIVVSVYREHTGAPGTFLYVYDAETGALEWRSPSLGTYWANLSLLRVGNIDSDPNPEIVVAEYGGTLWVFDGVTRIAQLFTSDFDITALDVKNIEGSPVDEIIVGNEAGSLFTVNPLTGVIERSLGSYGARISGLAFAQVPGTAELDAIFCAGGRLRVRYVDRRGLNLWSGEFVDGS